MRAVIYNQATKQWSVQDLYGAGFHTASPEEMVLLGLSFPDPEKVQDFFDNYVKATEGMAEASKNRHGNHE